MKREIAIKNINEVINAIEICLGNELITPALTLIYSGIDIMAALSRPAKDKKVVMSHYISWAEKYMRCEARLRVSGIDLYGARCGVIHTATADSRLSDKGDARKIFYAWGNRQTDGPMNLLTRFCITNIVFLKVEDLLEAFSDGVSEFFKDADNDRNLSLLVEGRADKIFVNHADLPGL